MRSSKHWIIAAVGALAACAAALAWLSRDTTPPGVALPPAEARAGGAPVMWPAPQFAFSDQNDKPVSTESLRGKVWIADFIFTSCANTCPKMTAKRVELMTQIGDPRVLFLSFSVDPQRDDRATRKTYAGANHIDESRWHFVSPPDKREALRIAESMKIAAVHGHGESPILHSDRFVLIDPHGRVRGSYTMQDEPSMQRLVRDAVALANETTKPE